MLTTVTTQI